ncbi:hypothetical protein HHL22_07980 [Hymenobacter sp. RP-2-7]|uniref:Uncharacterized protein n=1 Tax=Hymenobacter polaris TaxID=2682546 RepID=A0A7Y0FLT8_9BACT|nr:hypothetical protein [Hymenobacter polaris]NML65143.1 hypothetical protein [Hymenobacter polaris]
MKLAIFQKLRPAAQASIVLAIGTYLHYRLEAGRTVHLYYLAGEGKGFFIEVAHKLPHGSPVVVNSFEQFDLLADYVTAISLPAS